MSARPVGSDMERAYSTPAARDGRLLTGLACTFALSVAMTVLMAWPVVRSPGTMVFGRELVGRHHDPFTVMQQFASGGVAPPYQQPLTDLPGVWLTRRIGPVGAYNTLVLASFPLTAVATYLLGYFLMASPVGAAAAALAFAFAPVRVAQASYHVHVVQTQWLVLYILALFSAVERPTLWRGAVLVAAVAGLALAGVYGGLIGAVTTVVALPAYWLAQGRTRTWRALALPAACLALACLAALAVVIATVPEVISRWRDFAFPVEDVARYSARPWAYLLPPIDHPLFGGLSRWAFGSERSSPALLEQQLSLGLALTLLAGAGIASAWAAAAPRGRPERAVLAVAAVGAWSFVASLAPGAGECGPTSLAVGCQVHRIAPMFRGYARLGIMASLCVALAAGYAITRLGAARQPPALRTGARIALALALVLATIEWWPLPGRARDVLPTSAHRWLAELPGGVRALDCAEPAPADAALPWLMKKDVSPIVPPFDGCDDPDLAPKLAALGFTHVLTRGPQPNPFAPGTPPAALPVAAVFPDARVYAVSAVSQPVVLLGVHGFWGWERKDGDRWRWMGQDGWWTLFNTTAGDVVVTVHLDIESFAEPRQLALELDDREMARIAVAIARREYAVGPVTLAPGPHRLKFRSLQPALRPADLLDVPDPRAITIALHAWRLVPVP